MAGFNLRNSVAAADLMGLPLRSRPTDEDLISHYLQRKILGLPFSNSFESKPQLVIEVDMYGNGCKNGSNTLSSRDLFCSDENQLPWQRLHIRSKSFGARALHVFTRLPNSITNLVGEPLNRVVAGIGTWHESNNITKKDVYNWKGSVIGYKRLFTFTPLTGHQEEDVIPGICSMVEYQINPAALGNIINPATTHHDYVLCVILRTVPIINGEEEDLGGQRNNVFYTHCLVQDYVGLLVIDSGASRNFASACLVERLGLPTIKLDPPLEIRWVNHARIYADRQVKLSFSIGNYVDQVTCFVAPITMCDVILGRPWQYDRRVLHDAFTNKYQFVFNGITHTLVPLTRQKVRLLKRKRDGDRNGNGDGDGDGDGR